MKQTIHILFLIIILAFSGCKKDDVKVQSFNVVSESVDKHATSITITINYTYPSVIKTVEGYICENSNMDNATNAHGEINGQTIKLKFNDLQANTAYYYYYEYSNGFDDLTKSETKTITTNDYGLPTVTTNEVTDITATSAICGGKVTDNGEAEIISRGICYGLNENPTIDGNHTIDSIGIDTFSSMLVDLSTNTTYYVRAYATNQKGISYGEQKIFKTIPGGICGVFSVSATQHVRFSQGNLQYNASTNMWRFADNQYDYIGDDNSNISSTYNGWIDLFGWGTSGYNHGANSYQPWSISTNCDNYNAYGIDTCNLYDYTGQADWGYNSISNGGNYEDLWRTLTAEEWEYIFNGRNTLFGIRYAKAKVNGINGVILLPDNWNVDIYNLSGTDSKTAAYTTNIISATNWIPLELAGAVFLPASGYRSATDLYSVGSYGYYWSATYRRGYYVYYAYISFGDLVPTYWNLRMHGRSVRLVCDVE